MNASTLFKVLALVSANKIQQGDLTGVPVQFSTGSEMYPRASLTIDLSNRMRFGDNDAIPNTPSNSSATLVPVDFVRDNGTDPHDNETSAVEKTTFDSIATFNPTDLVAENKKDPRENEITAVEVLHQPNGVVFKPYFADAPLTDGNPNHISPKEALESVLKRCFNR